MKKLLFLLVLFASCEKEECWYCKQTVITEWGMIVDDSKPLERTICLQGADTIYYHEEICDRTEQWMHQYVKDNSGRKIWDRNGYTYIENRRMHCRRLTCF